MGKSVQFEEFNSVFKNFRNGVIQRGYYIKDFTITDMHEIIKQSIALSYRDVQRALHGIGDFQEEKANAIIWLEQELKSYFNEPPLNATQFNKWHKFLCDKIISFFCNYKRRSESGFTYGCAQKLINLAFKYIYCFDLIQSQYDKYAEYFRFCHITLDNGILRWIGIPEGVTHIHDYDLYICMQKKAFSKQLIGISDEIKLFPLEKEFMIYNYLQEKKEVALK